MDAKFVTAEFSKQIICNSVVHITKYLIQQQDNVKHAKEKLINKELYAARIINFLAIQLQAS